MLSHANRVCQAFYTISVYILYRGVRTMKLLKFSENLREALAVHGMSQQNLAKHIGTTQQTVSRWLLGINEPDLSTLLEICLYLDETPNSLLGYDDITEQVFSAYKHIHK